MTDTLRAALFKALPAVAGERGQRFATTYLTHLLAHPAMADWLAAHDEQVRQAERERLTALAVEPDAVWVPVHGEMEGRSVTLRRFLSDKEARPIPRRTGDRP
jgi:hypothetical protein